MGEWQSAEHVHRRALQHFDCSEYRWKQLKKPTYRGVGEPWAARVQGLIRNLQPPLKAPEFLRISYVAGRGIITAAVWFRIKPSGIHGPEVQAHVGAMAVHRRHRARGLGREALRELAEECFRWTLANRPDARRVHIVAEVHRHNTAIKQLISDNGWVHVGEVPDGEHEIWGAVVEILPPV